MTDWTLDRRSLLKAGGTAALASGLLGPTAAFAATKRRKPKWPTGALTAADATKVDPSQFLSESYLNQQGDYADTLGLRVPGTTKTEGYVHDLARLLRRAGVQDVRLEPVGFDLWQASRWSLAVDGKELPDTFYVPYSKQTGPDGVSAPLAFYDGNNADAMKGKIAVFEVEYTALPLSAFAAVGYPGSLNLGTRGLGTVAGVYARPYLHGIPATLDALAAAGAVATIGIWPDLPGEWASQYTPYDAHPRPLPGLWIDMHSGAKLRELAGNGAPAKVVLEGTTGPGRTHNVVGFIPGKSDELTVLHSHTDGTNGMEENGQIAVVAAAQYLARLPKASLERTVMVYLSTGHFIEGRGIKAFKQQHASDLVPRMTSILTLEHLGCKEYLPTADGTIKPTGLPELGAFFVPESMGTVNAAKEAFRRFDIDGVVARPFLPRQDGVDKATGRNVLQWPGEGTYFWIEMEKYCANFISGPYGLIAAGLKTSEMVDYDLFRRQAMTAVTTITQLASTSNAELDAPAL